MAWGSNSTGQTNVPAPNTEFIAIAAGTFHSLGLKGIPADFNSDGGVDLADLGLLTDLLSGPQTLGPPGFSRLSLDGDPDVDLADVASFQSRFGESW